MSLRSVRGFCCRLVACGVLLNLLSPSGVAQEDAEAGKEVIEFGRKQASTYRLVIGDQELELNDKAVLSWTNPERNSKHGTVFTWSEKGRVAAIACIYLDKKNEIWRHEFQSLTTGHIRAKQQEKLVWSTEEPGIQWQNLDVTYEAESTPQRRMTQFRKLADGFKARVLGARVQELRLLRQPLVRYTSPEHQVIDGVVFAFAQGTNPEVLLLIEATSEKEMPWRFALARMTGYGVVVDVPGREAWKGDSASTGAMTSTYYNRRVEKVPGSPD